MDTAYRLYGWPGSGSLAIQIALEDLGVAYHRVWVGREAADLERYRSLNPTGKSPALGLPDGSVMFESAAMLIHLGAAHPSASLAPTPGTLDHARFLQWLVFLSANLYDAVLRIYYSQRYSARADADAEAIKARALAEFEEHAGLVSASLAPYVLGAQYSLADPYLYMLTSWYPDDRAGLFARLPRLGRHFELVAARPNVMKVDQDHAT